MTLAELPLSHCLGARVKSACRNIYGVVTKVETQRDEVFLEIVWEGDRRASYQPHYELTKVEVFSTKKPLDWQQEQ